MKRLQKTLADYLVIAVSPALVMVLIGSLVFFLLEVFYRGGHGERLHFVWALFIFAAVLIARIAIEMGREHAMMYALPLALVMALAVHRFLDLPIWINLGLIGLIWWCADKLTFDCTLIDEDQDSSGEGLLQVAGLAKDGPQSETADQPPDAVEGVTSRDEAPRTWRERLFDAPGRPHAPGVWIVYFSLAALPLFGIGQRLIPAADLGRRQYAFLMLVVYSASALGLLLTTSFLGLRRYLRQRRIQMPAAMAGVWISLGAVMIAVLLGLAAILPRPNAEYAISKTPGQLVSRDQKASAVAVGRDAAEQGRSDAPAGDSPPKDVDTPQDTAQGDAKDKASNSSGGSKPSDQATAQGKPQDGAKEVSRDSGQGGSGSEAKGSDRGPSKGNAQDRDAKDRSSKTTDSSSSKSEGQGNSKPDARSEASEPRQKQGGAGKAKASGKGDQAEGEQRSQREDERGEKAGGEKSGGEKSGGEKSGGEKSGGEKSGGEKSGGEKSGGEKSGGEKSGGEKSGGASAKGQDRSGIASKRESDKDRTAKSDASRSDSKTPKKPSTPPLGLRWTGSIPDLVKWIFYAVLILVVLYVAWRARAELAAALRGFLEMLSNLWGMLFVGRRGGETAGAEAEAQPLAARRKRFAEFVDPFASGTAGQYAPAELVRYSFEAMETWGWENGCVRQPEQTAHEFSQQVGAQSQDMARDARVLADLYCRAAYAPGTISAASCRPLADLWRKLRSQVSPEPWESEASAASEGIDLPEAK